MSARDAGSKSSGSVMPFTRQIFVRSSVTSSYRRLTANHRGDSGITSLHATKPHPRRRPIDSYSSSSSSSQRSVTHDILRYINILTNLSSFYLLSRTLKEHNTQQASRTTRLISRNSMGPTRIPTPTLGMRLSCNFLNVYTL